MANDGNQRDSKTGQEPKWAALARAVAMADTEDFVTLAKLAGLDPAKDFRFADLSGMTFVGDLAGCDFTGARLIGCDFSRANVTLAIFGATEVEIGKTGEALDNSRTKLRYRSPSIQIRAREEFSGSKMDTARIVAAAAANDFNARKSVMFSSASTRARIEAATLADSHLPLGAIFIDAPFAPQMVVVPPGTYMRGTLPAEIAALEKDHGKKYGNWIKSESPQREVTVSEPFAVGRFPVTDEEWDLAQKHPDWEKLTKIAPRQSSDRNWIREPRPMVDVSWKHAKAFVLWLSGVTGRHYRLLSEAEWEYCCRAGTTSRYNFGDDSAPIAEFAWFSGNSNNMTQPVGKKKSNAFGLHDMHGNVWEWCEDVWHGTYDGAPVDGSARASKIKGGRRVVRGGSCFIDPRGLRSAARDYYATVFRHNNLGFRVARTLIP